MSLAVVKKVNPETNKEQYEVEGDEWDLYVARNILAHLGFVQDRFGLHFPGDAILADRQADVGAFKTAVAVMAIIIAEHHQIASVMTDDPRIKRQGRRVRGVFGGKHRIAGMANDDFDWRGWHGGNVRHGDTTKFLWFSSIKIKKISKTAYSHLHPKRAPGRRGIPEEILTYPIKSATYLRVLI